MCYFLKSFYKIGSLKRFLKSKLRTVGLYVGLEGFLAIVNHARWIKFSHQMKCCFFVHKKKILKIQIYHTTVVTSIATFDRNRIGKLESIIELAMRAIHSRRPGFIWFCRSGYWLVLFSLCCVWEITFLKSRFSVTINEKKLLLVKNRRNGCN